MTDQKEDKTEGLWKAIADRDLRTLTNLLNDKYPLPPTVRRKKEEKPNGD